jgi:hypothetical protein
MYHTEHINDSLNMILFIDFVYQIVYYLASMSTATVAGLAAGCALGVG